MYFNVSFAKRHPVCVDLNVLTLLVFRQQIKYNDIVPKMTNIYKNVWSNVSLKLSSGQEIIWYTSLVR